MVGLCNAEEKAFGPVQLQIVASVAPPVNVKVAPAQIGLGVAEAVTPVGTVLTVTYRFCVPLFPHPLLA